MTGESCTVFGRAVCTGLYALENNVVRLAEDHANAQALALGLSQIPGEPTVLIHGHGKTRVMHHVPCAVTPILAVCSKARRLTPHAPGVLFFVLCLARCAGLKCDPTRCRSNLVYFELEEGVDGEALVRELRDEFNVWIGGEAAASGTHSIRVGHAGSPPTSVLLSERSFVVPARFASRTATK